MKIVRIVATGVAGLVIAAALSIGAFAIAGGRIGEPAKPVSLPAADASTPRTSPAPSGSETPEPPDDQGGDPSGTSSSQPWISSPSIGDHGTDSGSDPSGNDRDADD